MRACMKYYQSTLAKQKLNVIYIDVNDVQSYSFIKQYNNIIHFDVCDIALENKLKTISKSKSRIVLESPMFFLSREDIYQYHIKNKSTRHAAFYSYIKYKINIIKNIKEIRNSKNMDFMNREKPTKDLLKRKHVLISCISKETKPYYDEAIQYANTSLFKSHIGDAKHVILYPITQKDAYIKLQDFVHLKLDKYGPYQDVILEKDAFVYHSVLSPILNIGILTPKDVLQCIVEKIGNIQSTNIPLNSIEGFIRQLIGWREYMRYLYMTRYQEMISSNVYNNTKRMTQLISKNLYNGTTGIMPFDEEVKKAVHFGYAHHIVRLMIFMNFFILSEYHPDDIYKWFLVRV